LGYLKISLKTSAMKMLPGFANFPDSRLIEAVSKLILKYTKNYHLNNLKRT
jgi:hypothetical protein